ncbi:MAG: hypothetical protein H8D47_02635 [Planctomycetes bacterium]|nr:hypothetical protein [Planctomycetota bacterium]MBL7106971.1 hypothetical protein [Phycisphaerae bacterium]
MQNEYTNLKDLKVLLGVSGGVAVYKAVDLASKLAGCGAKVRTVMTEAASHFVNAKSFEAVTKGRVYTNLWSSNEEFSSNHTSFNDWADVVVLAPATANIIGKIASGICDDLLTTTLCVCWKKPKLIAPAMNTDMWENPVLQENIEKIKKAGYQLIGPEEGRLACGSSGKGRMSEPSDILKAIDRIAGQI